MMKLDMTTHARDHAESADRIGLRGTSNHTVSEHGPLRKICDETAMGMVGGRKEMKELRGRRQPGVM